jgi:hypothetical protein
VSISRSSNYKIKFLLLIPILIVALVMLVACDSIGTDIKNKAKDLLQDVKTELKQSELPLSPQIATVESLTVSTHMATPSLWVNLKPTSNAIANKKYIVDLYEKGVLRDTTFVQWNQPELNVSKTRFVYFNIKSEEYRAYYGEDVGHIFSVRVHE